MCGPVSACVCQPVCQPTSACVGLCQHVSACVSQCQPVYVSPCQPASVRVSACRETVAQLIQGGHRVIDNPVYLSDLGEVRSSHATRSSLGTSVYVVSSLFTSTRFSRSFNRVLVDFLLYPASSRPTACPLVRQSVLSIVQSVHLPVHLSDRLSVRLFDRQFVCQFFRPPVRPPIRPSVRSSTRPFVHLFIGPTVRSAVRQPARSVRPSNCPAYQSIVHPQFA